MFRIASLQEKVRGFKVELLPALASGLALGLAGLVPGLHYAMVLLAAGPWVLSKFGIANGLLALVASVCAARAMHTLTVVYHPVAADQLASADPAQRLRAAGQGKFATLIMGESLWLSAVVVVAVVGVTTLIQHVLGINIIKSYLRYMGVLVIPAFLLWVGFMLWQAKNTWSTFLVFIASGILGVIALEHPSVRGSAQAMTPLLSGLFGIPILVMSILEKPKNRKEVTIEPVSERKHHDELSKFGLLAGILSVSLPGLGTSSLVSTMQELAKDDAQYLRMASVAESTGELLALALGILTLADRSSDAAVISRIVTAAAQGYELGSQFPWAMLAVLAAASWVSLKLIPYVGIPYRFLMWVIPVKIQSITVAGGMLWVVWSHTGGWGINVVVAGSLIHFGARKLGVPNQAFFACMVIPMCLSILKIHVW